MHEFWQKCDASGLGRVFEISATGAVGWRQRQVNFAVALGRRLVCPDPSIFSTMQEVVTLECTEAKKEGKPVSRYLTTRNKKTVTERIEKMKYNPNLRRHTLHKEIK
jgi:large subunit ribosomal protein L33